MLVPVLMLAMPALAAAQTFTAGDYASLVNAIAAANSSGGTITLTGNITLTAPLPQIGSQAGGIIIDGNGFTISGGNQFPGLALGSLSGSPVTVTIQNLTIQNTVATGAAGASGSAGGGGGAGLGGALFIGNQATVTVSNVNLINNSAAGGAGGSTIVSPNGGAGGLPSPSFLGSGGTGGTGGTTPTPGNAGGPGTGGGGAGAGAGGANGGTGGYGGGGGGSTNATSAAGGLGGGTGGNSTNGGGGGGGAGAGGAVFVQSGGSLQIGGAFTINGNSVTGGSGTGGGATGSAFGSGIFLGGFSSLTAAPAAGQTATINNVIADEAGSGGAGVGSVTMNGAGTLVLAGNNTYSGGTSISSGTLSVSSSSNLGASTGTIWADLGATLQITGSSTFANNVFMSGAFQMSISSGQSVIWNGTFSNGEGPGSLNVTGGGTLTLNSLSTANSYSAGTFVSGNSTVVIGDDGALGGGDLTLGDASTGGTLGINAPLSFVSSRNINLGAGGGTINAMGSTDAIIDGVIAGTGALTTGGTGRLTLGGANTYSGPTFVNSGTLVAGTAGAFGQSTSLSVASGAVADFNGFSQNFFSIAGSGTIALGSGALTVGGNNSSSLFAGTLSGSGGLVKTGTGTLTLSGTSTFTGGIALQAGTLNVSSDANLGGAGAVAMSNGTTLGLGSGSYGHSLLLGGTSSINVGSGQAVTWNGQIANNGGAGTLWLTGGGSLSLTNTSNSYSGGTVVAGNSTLSVSGDGALGAAGSGVTLGDATSSGTLGLASSGTLSRALTLGSGGGIVSTGSGATATLSGAIGGTGALQLTGGGVFSLTNTGNSYSGGTVVTGGSTLNVGANGTLGASSAGVTLGDATTSGTLAFGTSGTFSRAIALGTGGGIFNTAGGADVTLGGLLSGSGGLTKTGAGTLNLFGTQTFTGLTSVRQGTLALNGTLPGSVQVDSGATLLALGTIGGSVNLGGTLTVPSSGGTQISSLNRTCVAAPAVGAGTGPLLTINGNLTTTPGSTLNLPLVTGGAAPLQVNGSATLNGTQLNINVANPAPVRTSNYSAISTTGGFQITGGTVNSASSSLVPVLVANQNGLAVTILNLDVPLAPAASTTNGIAVAGALDASRGLGGDFGQVVREVTALDNAAFDPALRQLAGEIHATMFHMVDLDTLVFTDMVRGELSDHEHEAETRPPTGATPNVWFDAGGDHSNFHGGAFSGGIANVGGGGGGVDFRPVGNLILGGGGSLSFGGVSLGELSGSSQMTAPRGFAYAGWRFRQFRFHFGWSESHSSATTTRHIEIQALVPDAAGNPTPFSAGIDRIATSTQDLTARDVWTEVQYTRKFESYTFDGKFGARFAHYARTTFDETGAQSISLDGTNDVLSTREWNLDLHYFRRAGTWRPNLLFTYRREFGDLSTAANMSFAGNPNAVFTAQGTPIPRDTFEGLVGITMRSGKGLLWTLEYHYFKNSDETRNGLRWKVRL